MRVPPAEGFIDPIPPGVVKFMPPALASLMPPAGWCEVEGGICWDWDFSWRIWFWLPRMLELCYYILLTEVEESC